MKTNSFEINRYLLVKVFVVLYFSLIGLKYISGKSELLFVTPFIGGVLFLLVFQDIKKDKLLVVLTSWLAFFFLMSLLSAKGNEFRSIYYLATGFSAFVVGYVLYLHKRFSLKISWYLLIVFNVFILWSVILSSEHSSIALDKVFPGSSRNLVGAMAIFLQIFYTVSYYRINHNLPHFMLIITLLIIFLAYGRSSIIAGILLLAVYLIYDFKKHLWSMGLVAIIFLGAVFASYDLISRIDTAIEQNTNFSRGIDSPRIEILKEYISTTDLLFLIAGHPISDSNTAALFNGNPHNSYIRFHSYYGLASLLFTLFVMSILVKRFSSKTFIPAAFIIIYMFRAIFEPIAFFDIFDFLIFYLLLLMWFTGQKVSLSR